MIKLNLDGIKQVELDILLQFDAYCRANNLRYYLVGGTLLGAIRHKGFIPWDDDIDVCMPRPDYEKLLDEFSSSNKNNNKQLQLCELRFNNLDMPFSKLVALNSVLVNNNKYVANKANRHLWIDIFPVDGLPSDIEDVRHIYQRCDFYRKIMFLSEANLGEGKTAFKKWAKFILKPLANLYGKKKLVNKLVSIGESYPYEKSNFVGAVTWGLYGVGERMLKAEFEKAVEVEFEGYRFPAFSCWDSYLRGLYGDYMQLPPLEKRQTHDMEAYLLEDGEF